VPTAAYQLPAMTGHKRLMMPVGAFISGLHAWSAARLLVEPSSQVHLEALMLALHWYALSRSLYEVLARLWLPALLRPFIYTCSISVSGLVVSCGLLGALPGLAWAFVCLGTFNLLTWKATLHKAAAAGNRMHHGSRHLSAARVSVPTHITQKGVAKIVFEELDTDHSGKVDVAEVAALLVMWGLPESEAE
ncbi:unnamed protein product, partial [Polarella glacialis]